MQKPKMSNLGIRRLRAWFQGFQNQDQPVYLVAGAVGDMLLGSEVKDLDIKNNSMNAEISSLSNQKA